MTVGENLAANLGIDIINYKAVIQRSMNTSQAIYRVSINSRYPNKQLLYSQLRKLDSTKTGYYNSRSDKYKSFKWTPPYVLSMFDSPIPSNAIIIFVDISAEYMLDRGMYEAKVVGRDKGKVILHRLEENRLEEFTIYDFKSGMLDKFRQKFAKERQRVKGPENRLAKLINAEIKGDDILFRFLTEPTFEFSMPVVNPKNLGADMKNSTAYEIQILLVDFIPWLDEHELDFKQLSLKKFKEILQVVDVKLFCECSSFHWGGHNYELSKVDSSIYPTSIPHTEWSKTYDKNGYGTFGYGCKHLGNLYKNISIFESVMLGKLRELSR